MPFKCQCILKSVLYAALCILASRPAGAQSAIKPDSGKYILTVQESELGTDTFTTDADGGSESSIAITQAGVKATVHISIRAKAGQLKEIEAEAQPGGKMLVTVNGAMSKLGVGQVGEKELQTKDVSLPSRLFPYCTMAPEQLALILAAYNVQQAGPQSFDVVYSNALGPSGLIQGKLTITANGSKPMQVAGKTIPVVRYTLSVPTPIGNLDMELSADSDRHLLMLSMPSQKLYIIRDGYQDLNKPETPADPTLSTPTYTVKTERNVKVPMRDGVKLAADIYRPDAPGKFPVILQRTPYGRINATEASYYARRGYVFVAQDVRGKFDSEGEWQPWINEAKDGYDSVEWCGTQKWSTGSVGMIGASYLGFTQWAAARENNRHLKCLIPIVSPPDPFFNIPYAFGSLFLYGSLWWSRIVEGQTMNGIEAVKNLDGFKTLPVTDIDKALFGHHIGFFQEWLKHPTNDSFWDQVNFDNRMKNFGPLPALHVSGWFDGDGIGTKRNYQAMVSSGHKNQKLIYGPWSHAVNTSTKLGPLDFGPQSARDLDTLYLRWFDHWLKGTQNNIEKEPPVDVFLMGANEWRSFSAWPPKEAKPTRWYFHSKGHANSDNSDGLLSTEAPSASEPPDHYTYDPMNPFIPESIKKALTNEKEEQTVSLLESSKDPNLLSYTSYALEKEVVVAGTISVHLAAATSAVDTDWFAVIDDVYPDGKTAGLAQGIIPARFRKSFENPTLLKPGETADYTIDLWALGQVFQKGHRIRIVVTSSCFPIYARNLNTGKDNLTGTKTVVAQQTIFHTNDRASYVLLPVLPH